MGVLEDLEKFASKTSGDIGSQITNFGQDAQASVNAAVTGVAQLTGSGVGADGKIVGPLGDAFGHDPFQFVLTIIRKTQKTARALLIRYAERTNKTAFVINTPVGPRKVSVRPPANVDAASLALIFVLAATDQPAILVEEAGRQANGLPVKPRGLQGYTQYPMSVGGVPRGLFGIDDAVLLAIAVPIIIAIAKIVLPGLLSAAGNLLNPNPGPTPEEQAAAAKVQADEQQKTTITIGVVVAVIFVGGVGVYLATRHKKAA